ncbi:phosphopantetheine-binding protein [Xenophilus arseniciresistens]|uniref:Phosphopantetheine-binding protein n=1 Tax=Xenophilus arseniciresistens TaxID=1283306 RepID=A0AAE3NB08_9BURK|nr:phosphopantetheine-binding protein [Xenophilus arseniciresistens]MDA7416354.1 phosphopantetheine-binding protein [Xenophilus arseniciresistens]
MTPTAMDRTTLMAELPAMLLAAVERAEPPGGLQPEEPLFGPDARLDLDSLDALQLSMAIQKRYGVRMPDSKETRRALQSLSHLADHLLAHMRAQA